MQLLGTCSDLLVDLLRIHGISAVCNEGIVEARDYPPYQMALQIYQVGDTIVELEAICNLGAERIMREHLAGWGEQKNAAIMDAQQNFVGCVFHVWVAGLFNIPNEYATEENWKISGRQRRVTIGQPIARCAPDVVLGSEWEKAWHQAIKDMPLSDDVHWLSLCYGRHAGKTIACDALLDNERNEPLQDKVLSFDWAASQELFVVRQFLIVHPSNSAASN